MANTGINVSDEVISEFNDFKLGRLNPKVVYIIYKIEGGFVVTETKSEPDSSFQNLLDSLPEKEPRFILYDLNFTTTDGRPASKLILIAWAPDSASVKNKMIYSGTKDAVKRAFNGVGTNVTATDLSELTLDIIVDAARKFN